MPRPIISIVTASLVFGGFSLCAHDGHNARSPTAWLKLGKYSDGHPDHYDGYLTVASVPSLKISNPEVRFERSRLIALNSIKRIQDEQEVEEVVELAPPPEDPEPEEVEIVITEPEIVEVEELPEPIAQEDINSMYNEAGMLNPDDILLYLRDIGPEDDNGEQAEVGGAFRFQLPTNTERIRGEASLQRSP